MVEARTNLRGLATVVRLKTDVLGHLARSRSEEWGQHIDRFIRGAAVSELEESALVSRDMLDVLGLKPVALPDAVA